MLTAAFLLGRQQSWRLPGARPCYHVETSLYWLQPNGRYYSELFPVNKTNMISDHFLNQIANLRISGTVLASCHTELWTEWVNQNLIFLYLRRADLPTHSIAYVSFTPWAHLNSCRPEESESSVTMTFSYSFDVGSSQFFKFHQNLIEFNKTEKILFLKKNHLITDTFQINLQLCLWLRKYEKEICQSEKQNNHWREIYSNIHT